MAGATPFYFNSPKNTKKQILPADTTTYVTVLTAAAGGTKIVGIIIASDDTSARDVVLAITKSAVDYPLGVITIPITAGTIAATASVKGLDLAEIPGLPVDSDGNPYLFLETGDVLKAKVLVAVTAAKAISITVVHGDAV